MDPSSEINAVRRELWFGIYDHVFVNAVRENDAAILKSVFLNWLLKAKGGGICCGSINTELVPPSDETDTIPEAFPIANSVLSLEPKVKQNPGYQ